MQRVSPARFWQKVKTSRQCWLWQGCAARNGYGRVALDGRRGVEWAHRIAYELSSDRRLAPGERVRHRCSNRLCVNPHHLYVGPPERHSRAKLTPDAVIDIRAASARGASGAELARAYGVSRATISHIVNRKTWTDI